MNEKVRKGLNIFGSVLTYALIALAIYIFVVSFVGRQKGVDPFFFGYRPVVVLTGSMEPHMMTNSVILTKEVTSMDDIKVGDVVTYHLENAGKDDLDITHRIIDISDEGIITTKGDNNHVADLFPLTIENIEAKEVAVFNQTAWIVNTWERSTAGKVMLISIPLVIICLWITIKSLLNAYLYKDEIEEKDVVEYSKLCKRLSLSPREHFSEEIAKLRDQADEKEPSAESAQDTV